MLGICCCRCCFFHCHFFIFLLWFIIHYSQHRTLFFWSLKQQTTNGVTNLCIRKKTAYRRQSLDNASTTSLDMNLQGRETKRVINVYISILNSRGHCKSYSSSSFFMQERQILVCFFFLKEDNFMIWSVHCQLVCLRLWLTSSKRVASLFQWCTISYGSTICLENNRFPCMFYP